jgi:hypothetical protein
VAGVENQAAARTARIEKINHLTMSFVRMPRSLRMPMSIAQIPPHHARPAVLSQSSIYQHNRREARKAGKSVCQSKIITLQNYIQDPNSLKEIIIIQHSNVELGSEQAEIAARQAFL